MADLIQFDEPSGRRIARVVRTVEGMGPRARPLAFDPVIEELRRQGKVRLCKTTAEWDINTVATLDVWESGGPPDETQTAGKTLEAVNKTVKVGADKFVIVAKGKTGAWYLVEAETAGPAGELDCHKFSWYLDKLTSDVQGYDPSTTQALSHDPEVEGPACLVWLGESLNVITDVSLSGGALTFTRKQIQVLRVFNLSPIIISTTECPQ